jgi:hypothetical protein
MAATSTLLASARGLAIAQVATEGEPAGPPLPFGVVGLGPWGREVLSTLARMPSARIAAVCDSYAPALKKAAEIAPVAGASTDARALLDAVDVEAVLVATPPHPAPGPRPRRPASRQTRYCEAPQAHTVEDARASPGRGWRRARSSRVACRDAFRRRLRERFPSYDGWACEPDRDDGMRRRTS